MVVFVRWILPLVCDGLIVENGCEVCRDSCTQCDWEYANVDIVDDIHRCACVVIGPEG